MPKVNLSKTFFIFFFIFLSLFPSLSLISTKVYATSVLFEDNFNNELLDKWDTYLGSGGETWFENGELLLKAVKLGPDNPTYVITGNSAWKDYRLEAKLKGEVGVDKEILFRTSSTGAYGLKLVNSSYSNTNNLMLLKGGFGVVASKTFSNSNGVWYRIKIDLIGPEIKIYIDDMNTPKLEYDDPSPILAGGIALRAWTGDYKGSGSVTINRFDDIVVTALPSLNPLILLPGMTTCWNKALFTGDEAENWIFPELAYDLVYKNLIDSINNAGLKENEDWYLFCYDWRKPLHYNAEKLKNFIETQVNAQDKVNLVGHSMGGLISRTFAQTYPDDTDTVITLGSPHQGAVRAYPAWEGGQLWEYEGLNKLFFQAILFTNKKGDEHPMRTVRREIPSVKDLLPTFDFLIDQTTENYKNITTHSHQNETINQLDSSLINETKVKMRTIYGNNQDTLDAITVTSVSSPIANWYHQRLGLWDDGEPIHTCLGPICEYTDENKDYSSSTVYSDEGDKTVLVKSAIINGVQDFQISTDHNGLVNAPIGIEKIFDFLGISASPSISPLTPLQRALGLLVRSPAKITITAPDGKQAGYNASEPQIENNFYADEANFLIVPNFIENEYQIKITGTGEGTYGLLIAVLNDENNIELNEYQFPIHEEEIETFSINLEEPLPFLEDPDSLLAVKSAKTKVQNLEKKIKNKRGIRASWVLLERINKFISKEKYKKTCQMVEISLRLLNKSILSQKDDLLTSLLDDQKSAFNDLVNVFVICAERGNLDYQSSEIEATLLSLEESLQLKNQEFQQMTENGQIVPLVKVLLFEKTANLLQEAREAFEEGNLAKAHILELQAKFFLLKLIR